MNETADLKSPLGDDYKNQPKGVIYGSPSPAEQFFTQLVATKIG